MFQVNGDALVIKKVKLEDKDVSKWEQRIKALREESKILLTYKHRNIVQTYEVPDELVDANVPSLAMEFCPTGDLKTVDKPLM